VGCPKPKIVVVCTHNSALMSSAGTVQARELTSWKEIAAHLGVSVRTAQRWAGERGLPVRKLGGPRGRVLVTVKELEEWRLDAGRRVGWWDDLSLFRFTAVAITVAALAALAVVVTFYFARWRPGPPAQVRLEGPHLVVMDRRGVERWRHAFPAPPVEPFKCAFSRGQVFFVSPSAEGRAAGQPLYCFSDNGRLLWKYEPAPKSPQHPPPYDFRGLQVLPDGHVATAYVHHYGSPSQVAILDAEGRLLAEYWYPGHVANECLKVFDGQVLVGGLDYARRQATLVALDLHLRPRAEIRFPRAVRNDLGEWGNTVTELVHGSQSLDVHLRERPWADGLVYRFDREWKVTDVMATQAVAHAIGDSANLQRLRREIQVLRP